jgi:hypothetical protein
MTELPAGGFEESRADVDDREEIPAGCRGGLMRAAGAKPNDLAKAVSGKRK